MRTLDIYLGVEGKGMYVYGIQLDLNQDRFIYYEHESREIFIDMLLPLA